MHKTCAISTSGPNSTSAVMVQDYVYQPRNYAHYSAKAAHKSRLRYTVTGVADPGPVDFTSWEFAVRDRDYRGGT